MQAAQSLKNIETIALESIDAAEINYTTSTTSSMQSTLRSLDAVYNIFGNKYPDPLRRTAQQVHKEMLDGVQATQCKYIHKHMAKGKITPELCPLCETGTVAREAEMTETYLECREWEG